MSSSVTSKTDDQVSVSRCFEVCRSNRCDRLERYGNPPVNSTNYLCLFADASRHETLEEFESQDVPADCPFASEHVQREQCVKC